MTPRTIDTAPQLHFIDWLAARSDSELETILRHRPDTALPLPPSFRSLAARLHVRESISRALAKLTATQLATVEAAVGCGAEFNPCAYPDVVDYINTAAKEAGISGSGRPTKKTIREALQSLFSSALLYGDEDAFLLPPEVVNALPHGFHVLPQGPLLTEEEGSARLEDLSATQKKIVSTLLSAGGSGRTRDAAPDADPIRPIPKLISAGILERVDDHSVRLSQVAKALLTGTLPTPIPLTEPACADATDVSSGSTDGKATAQGLEVVRLVEELITALSVTPASTLKQGALGVRVHNRLAEELHVDEETVARVTSLAFAAGLISRGVPDPLPADDDGGDYVAPTAAADAFLAQTLAERWQTIVSAWLDSPYASWKVGEDDSKGKPIHLLSPETKVGIIPTVKAELVAIIGQSWRELSPADLEALYVFHHPITSRRVTRTTLANIVDEAQWIGLIVGSVTGALSPTSLVTEEDLGAVTTALTPDYTTQLIAQGDNTIVAPGPVAADMYAILNQLADVESPGLVAVYRVTEATIRRGLDAGLSASRMLSFLQEHVVGGTPESIEFLIKDVARRHGTLRGGPASSYIRCDDETLLLSACRTAEAESVGLRVIAPTIAIAQAPLIKVIDALRKAGFQPVAEGADGESLDLRPRATRVTASISPRTPAAVQARTSHLSDEDIAAAVTAIRSTDSAETRAKSGHGITDSHDILNAVSHAARGGKTITIGSVDKNGIASHRVVKPVTVTGGQMDALDVATGSIRRFLLHRITEVFLD